MKFAYAFIAMSLAGSLAQAATVECKAFDQDEVVQGLSLSPTGNELIQFAPAAMLQTRLFVNEVEVNGTVAKISGNVDPGPNWACAGSCSQRTFVLNLFAGEIAPNASLVVKSSGFNESTGRVETAHIVTRYTCTFSGLEALTNK